MPRAEDTGVVDRAEDVDRQVPVWPRARLEAQFHRIVHENWFIPIIRVGFVFGAKAVHVRFPARDAEIKIGIIVADADVRLLCGTRFFSQLEERPDCDGRLPAVVA